MPKSSKILAENISVLLKRHGLKAKDLARMVGAQPSAITRLTSGESNPNLSTIEEIAGAFGVTASEILRGPDDQVLVTIEQAFEILEQARKDERALSNATPHP